MVGEALETFLLCRCGGHAAVLADRINPQLHGQIFSLGDTELPAQFRRVTFLKNIEVEGNAARQKTHVVASFWLFLSSFDRARS